MHKVKEFFRVVKQHWLIVVIAAVLLSLLGVVPLVIGLLRKVPVVNRGVAAAEGVGARVAAAVPGADVPPVA